VAGIDGLGPDHKKVSNRPGNFSRISGSLYKWENPHAARRQEENVSLGNLIFRAVLQNVRDAGTDDERPVSRVYFDLVTPEGITRGLFSDVKLSPGAEFSGDPAEVSMPKALAGRLGYEPFRKHVESVYWQSLRPTGRIQSGNEAKGSLTKDNIVYLHRVVNVELSEPDEPKGR